MYQWASFCLPPHYRNHTAAPTITTHCDDIIHSLFITSHRAKTTQQGGDCKLTEPEITLQLNGLNLCNLPGCANSLRDVCIYGTIHGIYPLVFHLHLPRHGKRLHVCALFLKWNTCIKSSLDWIGITSERRHSLCTYVLMTILKH